VSNPARPSWLDASLFPFESHQVVVGGNRVHYVDEGSGPVVLFVHGNPDYSLLYRHQIQGLKSSYRCVAFDTPGFGLSEPADGFEFTPEEQACVLRDLIDQLDLRSITLVMHDWGGPIGFRAAQQRPDRFDGLVVMGTLAWPDYRRRASWWVRLMMGFLASERGRSLTLKNNLILEGPLRSEMNKGTHPPSEEIKAAYRGPFTTVESRLPTWVLAHHLWSSIGDSFLTTIQQDIANLRDLRALLVFGEADRYTTPKDSLPRFERAFPNHESVVIPGAGHFFPESAPEVTTTAIRDWLPRP
jgi:haloalkane dehalogenase